MDVIRSCYTTDMRLWKDSDQVVKVRWFFTAEDAEIFPGHHLFASGNWAADRDNWDGPGEVLDAPRTWIDGSSPGELLGKHFCGPDRAYREGASLTDPSVGTNADGISCCCTCQCDCDELILSFADTMQIEIVAHAGGGGSPIFAVGQTFRLDRQQPPGELFWASDWIPTPGQPSPVLLFRVQCHDWLSDGRLLSLGAAIDFDPVPTDWVQWSKEFCLPCYAAVVEGYQITGGIDPEVVTLRVTAQYLASNGH